MHSRAVPSHANEKTARREAKANRSKEERIGLQLMAEINAMDPANAFTFGPMEPGTMSGASTRSVASPWALPGGSNDACAPAVDLAALMQLTAWIKALGELIPITFPCRMRN